MSTLPFSFQTFRAESIRRSSITLMTLAGAFAFGGCATHEVSAPVTLKAVPAGGLSGSIHGGQPPVAGATLQLYAVGTSGDGSTPTALLATPVLSDLNGNFSFAGLYTCPSPSTLIYLVATGGNPGMALGTNNTASVMMAALGQCGVLASATFVIIDEVTTVAAAAALAPFTTPPYAIGSSTSDATALATAFSTAINLANTATGTSPGVGVSSSVSNTSYSAPAAEINSLANSLSSCVNSTGPSSSACTALFGLTGSPTDVLSAVMNVEKNPSAYNASAIAALAPSGAPFQPILSSPPSTFAISLTPPGGASTGSGSGCGGGSVSTASIATSPSAGQVGCTVVLTSLVGSVFIPPLNVNFGNASAAGSFTSTVITVTVPSGVVPGVVNGEVVSTKGTYPFTFYAYGTAVSAVTLSTGTLNFPGQILATQSTPATVTVTNSTGNAVQINSASASGGNATAFPVTANGCTGQLAAGASCTVSVAYKPTALGSQSSTLYVFANGSAITATVTLSGTGQ